MLAAEFFWKVFENTGSVTAYLLYRCFLCDSNSESSVVVEKEF